MRAKLLDSRKVSVADSQLLISRRSVLVGSGVGLALVCGYPLFDKGQAQAQHPLINALIGGIALAREIWQVFQPTEGKVTIVNRYDTFREGDILFLVVGPQGTEHYGFFPYSVPPLYQNTYGFSDGPYGSFAGRKEFQGKTARGQAVTHMYVEA